MQSPISGGLSGARRSVSASSVLGRPVLGSSLANEIAQASDRQTAAVLENNQIALQNVTNSINRISGQMILINNSLMTISSLVSQNAALENLQAQQKVNQERILAEQKLREGKESIIERKMQSVLAAPVQKIGAKAQFSLMNLMSFFNQLFFGWLLNQGVQTIAALATDNSEKLNEIKDNVLRNLRDVGLTLLALQTGFGLFRGGLLRIGTRIAQAIALQLFRRPITALFDAVKGIAKAVLPDPFLDVLRTVYAFSLGKVLPSGPKSPAETISGVVDGGAEGQPVEQKADPVVSQVAQGVGGLAAFEAGMRYTPGPGWLKVLSGSVFALLGSQVAEGIASRLFPSSTPAETSSDTTSDAATTTKLTPEEGKTDAAATINAKVSAPELQNKAASIPEPPKPKPAVTVLDAPAQEQASAGTQQKLGLANRVPSVSSSNPDNPFPLFSIVTYNVPAAVG